MMAAIGPSEEQQLLHAAEVGNLNEIIQLLKNPELIIDWSDPRDNCTALHQACKHGFGEVAAALMANLAQLDAPAKKGTNPVWIAASHGRVEVVRLLAESGVDFAELRFRHRFDGRTALNAAAQIGLDEVIRWLLLPAGSSDPFVPDKTNWSPIHYVCQRGHLKSLEELLKAGADPNQLNQLKRFVDCRILTTRVPNQASSDGPGPSAAKRLKRSRDAELPSWSPMHVAAHFGQTQAVRILLLRGADLFSNEDSASSILQSAAISGRSETICELISYIRDFTDSEDLSVIIAPAVLVSGCFGHTGTFVECLNACSDIHRTISMPAVKEILSDFRDELSKSNTSREQSSSQMESTSPNPDGSNTLNLSRELHSALIRAGFYRERAQVQALLVDDLEQLLRDRLELANQGRQLRQQSYVVGSFAEGWGGSFSCLDGNIEADSDIDVTTVLSGRVFHLKGFCQCTDDAKRLGEDVTYENGHVICTGFASNPSLPYGGSPLRPAMDKVDAYRCCCYPKLRSNDRLDLPPVMMELLNTVPTNFPCHLVPAARPDPNSSNFDSDSQLRVSTTFLEKYLLRHLTTVQGQIYVTLKYFLKRILAKKVNGLKSYHIKTILFNMLNDPNLMWAESNMIELLQYGLQFLINRLKETSGNQCMMHFFLPEAVVYLKRNYSDRQMILEAVQELKDNLEPSIRQFIEMLRPCDNLIRFHPFVLHPILDSAVLPDRSGAKLEYYEVYDAVSRLLNVLPSSDKSRENLLSKVSDLPDCARTTRQCLKVLIYLKFGMQIEAKEAVIESLKWEVSKGIDCSTRNGPTSWADGCRQGTTDSLYKFGLRLDKRPKLAFLPKVIRRCFPTGNSFYLLQYYMNFHALLRCLTLHLLADEMDKGVAADWFKEATDSQDSDAQELLMVLEFCNDQQQLVRLIHRHRRVICDQYETLRSAVELLATSPDLQRLSIKETLRTVFPRSNL